VGGLALVEAETAKVEEQSKDCPWSKTCKTSGIGADFTIGCVAQLSKEQPTFIAGSNLARRAQA
jgi:hypothetical protein